jgi:hypothetical protein
MAAGYQEDPRALRVGEAEGGEMATLTFFVYQKPSLATMMSIIRLATSGQSKHQWELIPENRDALIDRARSIAATRWFYSSRQNVLVMSDDDFAWEPKGLDALVELCIEKKGIAAGVCPLKSGEYTTIVPLDFSEEEPWRDPTSAPRQVRWAGGLVAYHRDVIKKLAEELPMLHKNDVIEPFYPFFMPMIYNHPTDGDIYLSEDYACQERAAKAGFEVWVQPACQVGHLNNNLIVTVGNMDDVKKLYV